LPDRMIISIMSSSSLNERYIRNTSNVAFN